MNCKISRKQLAITIVSIVCNGNIKCPNKIVNQYQENYRFFKKKVNFATKGIAISYNNNKSRVIH